MGDIQRWSEERSEQKLDDLLRKVGSMCSDQEIALLADAFGQGLPQHNALLVINALNEAGLTEANRPYHIIKMVGGDDGLLAEDTAIALILGAAEISDAGTIEVAKVIDALERLGVPSTPELKTALQAIGVDTTSDGKKWYSSLDVFDVLVGGQGAAWLASKAAKAPWKRIVARSGGFARFGLRAARKLVFKR